MKFKASTIFVCGFFLYTMGAYAAQKEFSDTTLNKPYLSFESGCAFSLPGNLDVSESKNPASGFVWDHSNDGWNNRLGNSVIFGINFGYNISKLLSLELAYNYRPSFKYEKLQTVYASSSIGTRIRHFDLDDHTLMLNGIFHVATLSTDLLNFRERTGIEPFINLGVGVARNTISNFHGISVDKQPGLIFSKMIDNTNYSFAGQAGGGLNIIFNPSWSMKVGYRFLYAGKFKTQDYVTDDPDGQHTGIPGSGNSANPWSGTLQTNEAYASLSYTW